MKWKRLKWATPAKLKYISLVTKLCTPWEKLNAYVTEFLSRCFRMQMFIWNNIFFSLGFDVRDHYKDFGGDSAAYAAPVCSVYHIIFWVDGACITYEKLIVKYHPRISLNIWKMHESGINRFLRGVFSWTSLTWRQVWNEMCIRSEKQQKKPCKENKYIIRIF